MSTRSPKIRAEALFSAGEETMSVREGGLLSLGATSAERGAFTGVEKAASRDMGRAEETAAPDVILRTLSMPKSNVSARAPTELFEVAENAASLDPSLQFAADRAERDIERSQQSAAPSGLASFRFAQDDVASESNAETVEAVKEAVEAAVEEVVDASAAMPVPEVAEVAEVAEAPAPVATASEPAPLASEPIIKPLAIPPRYSVTPLSRTKPVAKSKARRARSTTLYIGIGVAVVVALALFFMKGKKALAGGATPAIAAVALEGGNDAAASLPESAFITLPEFLA